MEQPAEAVKPARARFKRIAAVAVLVTVGVLAFGVYRIVDAGRHATRQTLCVHNLKHLFLGLEAFAKEHDGQLPARLSELWPKYLPDLEVLVCPEVQAACLRECGVSHPFPPNPSPEDMDALCSYAYVPGHTLKDAANTVIVYEKRDNHLGKGRSLLCLDGRGAWEPPENWRGGPPNRNLPPGFREPAGATSLSSSRSSVSASPAG